MKNTLDTLNYKALGSRSRRLSDYCFDQMRTLYHALNISFDPAWYAYLMCIHTTPHHHVQMIAEELGVSQPAVSKMLKRLQQNGLIDFITSPHDQRQRTSTLTAQGSALLAHITPTLKAVEDVLAELDQGGKTLLDAISTIEQALRQTSLSQRVLRHLCTHHPLTLTPYDASLHSFYEEQNRAWVSKYFTIEPIDDAMLRDPSTHILSKGGHIYIAMLAGCYPLGGFSLIPEHNGFELSKMYVPESLQGLGIGDSLLSLALRKAKELGAESVMLLSNTKLAPAIHLYRKHGFIEVPIASEKQGMYARANIMMEHRFVNGSTQAA